MAQTQGLGAIPNSLVALLQQELKIIQRWEHYFRELPRDALADRQAVALAYLCSVNSLLNQLGCDTTELYGQLEDSLEAAKKNKPSALFPPTGHKELPRRSNSDSKILFFQAYAAALLDLAAPPNSGRENAVARQIATALSRAGFRSRKGYGVSCSASTVKSWRRRALSEDRVLAVRFKVARDAIPADCFRPCLRALTKQVDRHFNQ